MSGSLEQSIKKYTEELAKNPKSRSFVPLADAYRASGRTEEAIEVAKQGVALYPHYVGGKMALARAYFEHGESELAREILEDILRTAPDNLLANRILAEIYTHMDQRAKAIPLLKRLLSVEPNDEHAAKQLADLEKVETPKTAASVEPNIQESVDEEAEDEPEVRIRTATMAEMYRAQGHLDEALAVYQELLAKEPKNSQHQERINQILAQINAKRSPPMSSPKKLSRSAILNMLLAQIQERRRSV